MKDIEIEVILKEGRAFVVKGAIVGDDIATSFGGGGEGYVRVHTNSGSVRVLPCDLERLSMVIDLALMDKREPYMTLKLERDVLKEELDKARLLLDRLLFGNSFELCGKRIDPRRVMLSTDGTYEITDEVDDAWRRERDRDPACRPPADPAEGAE